MLDPSMPPAPVSTTRTLLRYDAIDELRAFDGECRDIGVDHDLSEARRVDLGDPAEQLLRLRGVSDQGIHFGRAQVALVKSHILLPVEPDVLEGELQEVPYRVRRAGCDHIVGGLIVLE